MSNDELEVNHHGRFDDTDEPFEAYVTLEGGCYWRVDNQTFQLVNHQEGKKRQMKHAEFMAKQALIALNKLTKASQNECSEGLEALETLDKQLTSDPLRVEGHLIETIRQALTRSSVDLPPRPPLNTPEKGELLRYGITWTEEKPNVPLLSRMHDGYWTPWHLAQNHINTTTGSK